MRSRLFGNEEPTVGHDRGPLIEGELDRLPHTEKVVRGQVGERESGKGRRRHDRDVRLPRCRGSRNGRRRCQPHRLGSRIHHKTDRPEGIGVPEAQQMAELMGRHPGARRNEIGGGRLRSTREPEQPVDLNNRRAAEVAVAKVDLGGVAAGLAIRPGLIEEHRGIFAPRRRRGHERDLEAGVDRSEAGQNRSALGGRVDMLARLGAGIEVEEHDLRAAIEGRGRSATIVGEIGACEEIVEAVPADRVGSGRPNDILDAQAVGEEQHEPGPHDLGRRGRQIDRDSAAGEAREVERIDPTEGTLLEEERSCHPANEVHPLVTDAADDPAEELLPADHGTVGSTAEIDHHHHGIAMEIVTRGVVHKHVIPGARRVDEIHAIAVVEEDVCLGPPGNIDQADEIAIVADRTKGRVSHAHEADTVAGVGEREKPAPENVDPRIDAATAIEEIGKLILDERDLGRIGLIFERSETDPTEVDLRSFSLIRQGVELDATEIDGGILLDRRAEVGRSRHDRDVAPLVEDLADLGRGKIDNGPARRRHYGTEIGTTESDLRAVSLIDQSVELDAAEIDRVRLLDQRLEVRPADIDLHPVSGVEERPELDSPHGDRCRLLGEGTEVSAAKIDLRSFSLIDQRIELDAAEIDRVRLLDQRLEVRAAEIDGRRGAVVGQRLERPTAQGDRRALRIAGIDERRERPVLDGDRRSTRRVYERVEGCPGERDPRPSTDVGQGGKIDPRLHDGDGIGIHKRRERHVGEVDRDILSGVDERAEGDPAESDRRAGRSAHQGAKIGRGSEDRHAVGRVENPLDLDAAEIDLGGLLDQRLEVGTTEVDFRPGPLVDQRVELDCPDGDRPLLVDERPEVDTADADRDVVGGVLERLEVDATDGDVGGLLGQSAEVGTAEIDLRAFTLIDQRIELDAAEVDRVRLLDQGLEVRPADVDRRLGPLVDERGELGPGEVERGAEAGVEDRAKRRRRQIDDRPRRGIDEALEGGIREADCRPRRTILQPVEIGARQVNERPGAGDDQAPEPGPGQIDLRPILQEREAGRAEIGRPEIGACGLERHRISRQGLGTVDRAGGNRHVPKLGSHQERVDRCRSCRSRVADVERACADIERQIAAPPRHIEQIARRGGRGGAGSDHDRSIAAGLEGIDPRAEIDKQRTPQSRRIERTGHGTVGEKNRKGDTVCRDRGSASGDHLQAVAPGGAVDDQIVPDDTGGEHRHGQALRRRCPSTFADEHIKSGTAPIRSGAEGEQAGGPSDRRPSRGIGAERIGKPDRIGRWGRHDHADGRVLEDVGRGGKGRQLRGERRKEDPGPVEQRPGLEPFEAERRAKIGLPARDGRPPEAQLPSEENPVTETHPGHFLQLPFVCRGTARALAKPVPFREPHPNRNPPDFSPEKDVNSHPLARPVGRKIHHFGGGRQPPLLACKQKAILALRMASEGLAHWSNEPLRRARFRPERRADARPGCSASIPNGRRSPGRRECASRRRVAPTCSR